MTNIATENGPFIDDLAMKRLIFHSNVKVYQRLVHQLKNLVVRKKIEQ